MVKLSLVGIIIVLLALQIVQVLETPSYGVWGIFHYYIGAKYLKELGYFNLYSCAVQTKSTAWSSTKMVRDLHTYTLMPPHQLSKCDKNRFTNERWNEFVADMVFITNHASDDYWSQAVTDKGFNPPPSWAALAGTIAHIVPINNRLTYTFLFNLDLLFVCFAALLVWYDSGRTLGLITLALSLLYFGTFDTLGNNFIQYAWYPFIVGSVVAWRRKRMIVSGTALGFAAGLQIFPAFFALPVGFFAIISLVRKKNHQAKSALFFMLSFTITLLFCILLGSIYVGKTEVWRQWYTKITIHKQYLNGEIFDIGLPNLVGTVMSKDYMNANSYTEDYPYTQARNKTIKQNLSLLHAIVFLGLLLTLCTLWRSKQNQPITYGYFILYLLLSLSPYYYLILALLPFMFWNNTLFVRRFVLYGISILFLSHLWLFWNSGYISFIYNLHLLSEVSIFFFLTTLILLLFFEKQNRQLA